MQLPCIIRDHHLVFRFKTGLKDQLLKHQWKVHRVQAMSFCHKCGLEVPQKSYKKHMDACDGFKNPKGVRADCVAINKGVRLGVMCWQRKGAGG